MVITLGSRGGAGATPQSGCWTGYSHPCLRPLSAIPTPRSPLPFQPVCPKSTIWGNLASWVGPHFQTVCFPTGETHPPHRHREPAPKVCPHRLMSQAFWRRTPTGLTENLRTASVCLVYSAATPKFKIQSHRTIKAQTIMNKYERLQKGKKKTCTITTSVLA